MKPNTIRVLAFLACMAPTIALAFPDGGVAPIPLELQPLPVAGVTPADVGVSPLPVVPPVPIVAPAPVAEPTVPVAPVVEPVPVREALEGLLGLLLSLAALIGAWAARKSGVRSRAEWLALLADGFVHAAEEWGAREAAAGRKPSSQEKLGHSLALLRKEGVAGDLAVTLIDAALGRAAGLGASGKRGLGLLVSGGE